MLEESFLVKGGRVRAWTLCRNVEAGFASRQASEAWSDARVSSRTRSLRGNPLRITDGRVPLHMGVYLRDWRLVQR
jgi:hypothetical protein